MSLNHPVSDLVTRIRNGYLAKKIIISAPVSRLRGDILQILKDEGYILNYSKLKEKSGAENFNIQLKYHNAEGVVNEITVISKPGKRVYCAVDEIPLIKNGLGMVVLSTSGGVISDHEARNKKLGGEILFTIF